MRGRLGTVVVAVCVVAAAGCGTDSGVTSDRADSVPTETVAASPPATTGSPQTSPSTDPTDSTDSTGPTDSTDSTDATGPTDSTDTTDPTDSTESSGPDTTSEGAKPMLSLVVLDGSDVAADDVDAHDLLSSTSNGMLFLTNSQLVVAGLVDDEPSAVDLASVIDPAADLSPVVSAIASCGDVVVAVRGQGDDGDHVVAIDVTTGEERWRVDAPDPEGGHPVACGDTDVAVTAGATGTIGLSLADGSPAWSSDIEPDDPPLAYGGSAVIGSYDGVVLIDSDTGKERWRVGESSDQAITIGAGGVVIDESQGLTLYSLAGEQLAVFPTLSDDVGEQTGESFDLRDLRVAGPPESPVLTIVGTGVVVELDGTVRALTDADDDAEVVGTSGELIWMVREGRDEVVVERVGSDGTVSDATRADEEFEAILGTDRVLFGHVDGVPAMVVTLF